MFALLFCLILAAAVAGIARPGPQPPDLATEFGDAVHLDLGGEGGGGGGEGRYETGNPLGTANSTCLWSKPFPLPLDCLAPSTASAPFDGNASKNLPSFPKPWRRTRTLRAFLARRRVISAIPSAVASLSTSVAGRSPSANAARRMAA